MSSSLLALYLGMKCHGYLFPKKKKKNLFSDLRPQETVYPGSK